MKKLIILALTAVLAASMLVSCSSDSSSDPQDPIKPVCNITSPSDNDILYPGDDVIVVTEAAATEGEIDSVRFSIGDEYKFTDKTTPFNYTWNTTGLAEQEYMIKAKAYASNGTESETSEVQIKLENQAPTCSITNPETTGKAYIVGSKIILKADANDVDGTIASVKFKLNGVLLGTQDTEAPYEIEWNTLGYDHQNYTLKAIATDNDGKETVSDEIVISLNRGATLENLELDENSFWNGSDQSGGFNDGSVHFINSYNTDYSSWSGTAYSNMTDKTTAGYDNQYSAYADGGANGSENFAVCYPGDQTPTVSIPSGDGAKFKSLYINNTTLTYLSMQNGDTFAKKFGGEDGTDPDWFMLTIHGMDKDGNETSEAVEFYLADYRSEHNYQDYIVDAWTEVDLTPLGSNVKQLKFVLSSSDNGDYGMNTPAYFAFDDLVIEND